MAKEEWGSKHICPDCNTKFYDLQRDPIQCPKCGKLIVIDNSDLTKRPVDEEERVLVDDDAAVAMEDGDDTDVGIDDNVLDDSDDDTIPLEEISDIPDERDD